MQKVAKRCIWRNPETSQRRGAAGLRGCWQPDAAPAEVGDQSHELRSTMGAPGADGTVLNLSHRSKHKADLELCTANEHHGNSSFRDNSQFSKVQIRSALASAEFMERMVPMNIVAEQESAVAKIWPSRLVLKIHVFVRVEAVVYEDVYGRILGHKFWKDLLAVSEDQIMTIPQVVRN